jgi:hypothetical protein
MVGGGAGFGMSMSVPACVSYTCVHVCVVRVCLCCVCNVACVEVSRSCVVRARVCI